ncbi:DUF2505 domain-containing protein [Actinotalea sp. K2]|uniref:DUF2505 domain-containing protein n=1 Tax=Actinotalea sp. K2 TaxID=2939438 RepID=UPI002017DA5C|nr:DUF2505 domain-containing protein [Actinotalea sp. K2]MCL3862752.1 DUF2505 domain-containing protein [Actinotalea sp. K2]
MHVSAQANFQAGPDRVAQMLADEDFVAAKVRASGATSQHVDVVGTSEGAFTVTTRRQMPTTSIPAQFRSVVGSSLEVRQVEAWEAAEGDVRRGTVVVEITGAPVRMTGTLRLAGNGDGTSTQRYDGQLKASVPIFGAAIEEATAGAVRAAIEAEERTAADWLTD